ncbi:MAG: HU family DNA-binding protein [Parcubacteria group bacterium]|nr:HU family DNA-binding protein [Parcubacteria group bacterium]
MSKQDVINTIAGKLNVSKRVAADMLDTFIDEVTKALQKGEKVTISGFGTFLRSQRKARTGVNPRNPGEKISIPALRVPRFKAGKQLKEAVR